MKKIKNLTKEAWNFLPINLEIAVYNNQKEGLVEILNEPENINQKKNLIMKYNNYTARLMTAATFVDGLSFYWFYGGLMNIFDRQEYLIGSIGLLGSIFLRGVILYQSKNNLNKVR